MPSITYTVTVAFDDSALADAWLHWLTGGHIADVLAGGATDAELVELDGPTRTFEVRYHFPSREGLARYEREHAPRLPAEGLRLFPPEKGVTYRRALGEVAGLWRSG
jgi:hypothetical protein